MASAERKGGANKRAPPVGDSSEAGAQWTRSTRAPRRHCGPGPRRSTGGYTRWKRGGDGERPGAATGDDNSNMTRRSGGHGRRPLKGRKGRWRGVLTIRRGGEGQQAAALPREGRWRRSDGDLRARNGGQPPGFPGEEDRRVRRNIGNQSGENTTPERRGMVELTGDREIPSFGGISAAWSGSRGALGRGERGGGNGAACGGQGWRQ
jgi:hypothetical protein